MSREDSVRDSQDSDAEEIPAVSADTEQHLAPKEPSENSHKTTLVTGKSQEIPQRGRKKNTFTVQWLAFPVILAMALGILSSLRPGQGALVYSKYVDEVLENPSQYADMDVRVEGIVAAGTLENRQGTPTYRFRIERNHRSMAVVYEGVVPDTFREGSGVTVRGRLGSNGVFTATELIAKCPSKYEEQATHPGQNMPGRRSH